MLIRHRMLTLCNNHPIFRFRGIFACLIISVAALFAVIVVYSTVPGLWNAHNKVLILYVSTFLFSSLLIIVRKLTIQSLLENTFWCKVIGTYSIIVLKITLKVIFLEKNILFEIFHFRIQYISLYHFRLLFYECYGRQSYFNHEVILLYQLINNYSNIITI